ncbi:MAG: cytochrome c [Chloroflexota bacterium]
MIGKNPRRIWSAGRWFVVLLVLSVLASLLASQGFAAPPAQSADEGMRLFQEKGCSACHTIGQGDRLGPDLKGVTDQRDTVWLTRWLLATDKVLAEKDPIATELLKKYNNVPMPNIGLTADQVASLLAYLETTGNQALPQPTSTPTGGLQQTPVTGLPAGDQIIGKNLFTGATRLQNGGPPCLACHSITGIGALGGGALGPDLTGAYDKFKDAIVTWPGNVPPMQAIYSGKPMTEQEKAHLLAFFTAGVEQRPTQAVWQLTGLAITGGIILLAIAGLVWRRRLRNVRRSMVAGQEHRSR